MVLWQTLIIFVGLFPPPIVNDFLAVHKDQEHLPGVGRLPIAVFIKTARRRRTVAIPSGTPAGFVAVPAKALEDRARMLQRIRDQYPALGGVAHAAPARGMHAAVGNENFGFFSTGRVNRFQTHAPGACARRFRDSSVFAGFIAD